MYECTISCATFQVLAGSGAISVMFEKDDQLFEMTEDLCKADEEKRIAVDSKNKADEGTHILQFFLP